MPQISDWLLSCSVGTTRTIRYQYKVYDPIGNCEVYDVECEQVCVRGDGPLTANYWAATPAGCTAKINVSDTTLCV